MEQEFSSKYSHELNAVAICGLISSGKSFIAKELASKHAWHLVSFSNYIKNEAASQNLMPTREVYQQLGQELFTSLGAKLFLTKVISFNEPLSKIHLYDSIRHISIIEALQDIYHTTLVVFLDVTDETRYKRYSLRASKSDKPLSLNEFFQVSNAPIEQGIKEIRQFADLIVDGSQNASTVVKTIEEEFRKKNFNYSAH